MATWRTVVRTTYPGPGGPGFSTFHFRDDADGGLEAALQLATNTLRDAYTNLAPAMGGGVQMGMDGRWVEADGDRLQDTTGWAVTGSGSGTREPLPTMSTLCVSWGTASNSRSGRGRTFLSGWDETHSTAGVPIAAALTPARALGAELVEYNATLGNGAFVVYSRSQGLARDITRSFVNPIWASLRSRRD